MVRLAKVHTDEAILSSGMELNLEEDPNLELKLHIPQQGYASDSIWNIPPGLQDYLDPLISAGMRPLTVSLYPSQYSVGTTASQVLMTLQY